MKWLKTGAAVAGVVSGGLVARRLLTARGAETVARWHSVTVNLSEDRVAPDGRLPDPVAALGDDVEVRLRPAPGGRGTEIAVRLRDPEPAGPRAAVAKLRGADPRWPVRKALREAKSRLETGEVLHPSQPPTTRRTLPNRPLAFAVRHGREEGLL
ncbi:hypothetical protein WEI85_32205 [Actinomycetes bacterium KLBMP 9797]